MQLLNGLYLSFRRLKGALKGDLRDSRAICEFGNLGSLVADTSTDKCKRRKGCNAASREVCMCVRVCIFVCVCVCVCVRERHYVHV